jgi:hypothetical protein
MNTIYKYPISTAAAFTIIDVPKGAVFIHVAEQFGTICLWAMVDSEAPLIKRQIRVIGTGLPADDVKIDNYIGSILVLKGTYVFHIFDAGPIVQ